MKGLGGSRGAPLCFVGGMTVCRAISRHKVRCHLVDGVGCGSGKYPNIEKFSMYSSRLRSAFERCFDTLRWDGKLGRLMEKLETLCQRVLFDIKHFFFCLLEWQHCKVVILVRRCFNHQADQVVLLGRLSEVTTRPFGIGIVGICSTAHYDTISSSRSLPRAFEVKNRSF